MSLTIASLIGLFLSQILGDTVDAAQIANFIQVGGLIIFTALAWIGRVRKGDLEWWGGRK